MSGFDGDFTEYVPQRFIFNGSSRSEHLNLLIDLDDLHTLTWLGLPFDKVARPDEVLRALIHMALDECRLLGTRSADPALAEMIHRLRQREAGHVCRAPNEHGFITG